MKREIKFRAWDIVKEKMVYKDFWDRNWYGTPYNDKDGCHTMYELNHIKSVCYIMQYTGLKDKNGKEIYDGDLIEGDHQQIYEVFFNDNKAVFSCCIRVGYHKNTYFEPYYSNDLLIEDVVVGDYEVIGNIPENSEILTNKGQ